MSCGMLYAALKELPPSPVARAGWPWTEESPRLPETLPDGSAWPRVSIVTPSYNQGQFLEETIRSVLLQGYPNLEYLIIDGGSSDGSVEIIRRYEPWLTYWVSETDAGQSDAINKGFARATGEVLNWINSDDLLMPVALQRVAEAYHPSTKSLIVGDVVNFESESGKTYLVHQRDISLDDMVQMWKTKAVWHQPGIFFPASVWRSQGGLRTTLHYAMDYDLFCRFLRICPVTYIGGVIAGFRLSDTSKGVSDPAATLVEKREVARRNFGYLPTPRIISELLLFTYMCRRSAGFLKRGNGKACAKLLLATVFDWFQGETGHTDPT